MSRGFWFAGLTCAALLAWHGASAAEDAQAPAVSAGSTDASPAAPTASQSSPSLSQFENILGIISGSLKADELSEGIGDLSETYGSTPPQPPPWGGTAPGFAPYEAPMLDPQTRQKIVDDLNERLNSPNVESDASSADTGVRDAMLSAINAEPDPAKRQELLQQLDDMENAAQPLQGALDEALKRQ